MPSMRVKIYHNPRCSKSRQTLSLLQEQGIEPEVIEYLQHPPGKTQLKKILALLDMQPRDLMRKKEAEYKENHLDDPTLSKDQLIDAMIQHPKLIERPIVLCGDKAALGRPPEKVLEIIND
jgi:arsenate reductase